VHREGAWPSEEKSVTLDLDHVPRNTALQKLAEAAEWSIVTKGVDTDPIDVHVKNQPATKVLDIVLEDGSFIANRDGTLISIRPETKDAAVVAPPTASVVVTNVPPPPPVPPVPTVRGEDRRITGGNLRIEKEEVVHNVSLLGGNLDVYGTVTGKIEVTGGNVHLYDGAHVLGNVTTMGGTIDVADGAIVDGDVGVVGGNLKRGPKSKIGGAVEIGNDDEDDIDDQQPVHRSIIQRAGDALTASALLFVFGAVLLTLMGRRMETLQAEVAARPMRSFALGILGFLGFGVSLVALTITIVGIPVAIALAIFGVLAMYAGFCAVLTTIGRAFVRHKSESPYVHLAVGCAVYLIAGHLPFIGGILTLALGLVGIGTLVSTRVGGLWPGKNTNAGEGSYRTSAV
jgi:hypothetical protein